MAAMSLQDIRDYVRTFPDLDEEDLPNALLDRMIQEGFNRVARAERQWSFYATTGSFTCTPNLQTYNLASLLTVPLADIATFMGERYLLKPMPHGLALRKFPTSYTSTSEPVAFSVVNEALYLWPTPGAAYTYTVSGYRKPNDWLATNSTVDLPEEFHQVVATWALSRAYSTQDDTEQAAYFKGQFEEDMRVLRKQYTDEQAAWPLTLNESSAYLPENQLPSRLRFPWE